MRLEVQIDDKDPVIYVLNKPEIYVGSTPSNDIVINYSEISRKHLKIIVTSDSCHVIDQGSTNGSFINEARLVPGRRTEFTSFESLRLGDKVYLTLLVGRETATLSNKNVNAEKFVPSATKRTDGDKTRIISLKELHAAKTKKIAKKRAEVATKKRAESKRIRAEKEALKRVSMIALMWVAVGGGLHIVWRNLPDVVKRTYAPQKMAVDRVLLDESLAEMDEDLKVPEEVIFSREKLLENLNHDKCITAEENIFCPKIPEFKMDKSGVLEVDQDLIFYLQDKKWIIDGENFLVKHVQVVSQSDPENAKEMATFFVIAAALGKSFPVSFRARNIYIVLYSDSYQLTSVAVFKSQILPTLMMKYYIEEKKLDSDNGLEMIKALNRFVQFRYE